MSAVNSGYSLLRHNSADELTGLAHGVSEGPTRSACRSLLRRLGSLRARVVPRPPARNACGILIAASDDGTPDSWPPLSCGYPYKVMCSVLRNKREAAMYDWRRHSGALLPNTRVKVCSCFIRCFVNAPSCMRRMVFTRTSTALNVAVVATVGSNGCLRACYIGFGKVVAEGSHSLLKTHSAHGASCVCFSRRPGARNTVIRDATLDQGKAAELRRGVSEHIGIIRVMLVRLCEACTLRPRGAFV